jgi:hypothetical protein
VLPTVHDVLKLAASPAAMLEFAGDLHIGSLRREGYAGVPADRGWDAERGWLPSEGLGVLREVAERDTCAALVRGVGSLVARDLPASFVYAFDEAWAIGDRIRQRVTTLLCHEYVLLEDLYAWQIPLGSSGWPPHRGISEMVLDRDAPEIVNVWVALGDVAADQACMHAVPLAEDPGYPHALDGLEAPLSSVRALPVSAGDALFWNANVIHWSGRCSERAREPRVSCSFTLCRSDAASRFPALIPLRPLDDLDLPGRMDAVARMLLLYGAADRGNVHGVIREWATLTHELASRFGHTPSASSPLRKAP